MRLALLAVCLLGCIPPDHDDHSDDYWSGGDSGWGSGWGGDDGLPPTLGCTSDAACGSGLTCTRTGECLASSMVRAVYTLWTVDGMTASDATCSAAPKLAITFSSNTSGEQWGYTPVPCNAGKFTVDKFPMRFTSVQLAREGDYTGGVYRMFDAQGTASLDLPY
jgi:hypothetical protein